MRKTALINSELERFDVSEVWDMFLDFSQIELDQLNNKSEDFSATDLEFWTLIVVRSNPIHSLSLQSEGKL